MQGLSADTYFYSIPVALLSFSNMLEKMRRESMIAGIVDYRVCGFERQTVADFPRLCNNRKAYDPIHPPVCVALVLDVCGLSNLNNI